MKITKEQLQKMIKEALAETMQQEAPKPKREFPDAHVVFELTIPIYPSDSAEDENMASEETAKRKISRMSGAELVHQLQYLDTEYKYELS